MRRWFKIIGKQRDMQMLAVPEAALHRCSYKKGFWKYAIDLQQNINAEDFNKVGKQLYWKHTLA